MSSVAFENLPQDATIADKFNEIKQLAEIIKAESQAAPGHTDPKAYWECWNWLQEAMDELALEMLEIKND
jgi:hypothetical protein